MSVPIQSDRFSRRIYASSWLAIGSVLAAASSNLPLHALLCSGVLGTSVLYWQDPQPGFRRNIDMALSTSVGVFHIVWGAYALPSAEAKHAHMVSVTAALGCYGMARYEGRHKKNHNASSWWHVALHVTGNLSNILLYDAMGSNRLGW